MYACMIILLKQTFYLQIKMGFTLQRIELQHAVQP
jgi:hypothetical protein